jgi:hypothetical protein
VLGRRCRAAAAVRQAAPASRLRSTAAEGGEAGQIDRSGQQLPVLGHAHQSAYASASAAVAAAQQVGELALHLGPGRPVVGPPGRVALAGPGGGQLCLVRVEATTRPATAPVQA